MRQTCLGTTATCPYRFARFPCCGIFTIPYHPSKNYELKQQGDGASETSRNNKLRVAWHGLGNTRARRTNTAKRAPNMHMHHDHVSIPVCTISILWNFHTNPYHPSKNYELQQQGDGAGDTSITTNYELHGTG